MSTPLSAPCKFEYPQVDCNCTYSTVVGAPPADATTVATKVGDDFQFYGLRGIGGITVTQNLIGGTIDISGAGGGPATLQSAYNNGNTIVVAGGNPVDIQSSGVQPALNVHDAGPTGLFSITSAGINGSANIVNNSVSGFQLNPAVSNATVPNATDPFLQLLTSAPPDVLTRNGTMVSALNIGAAVNTNDVFRFTPAVTPANTVTLIDLDVVGYAASLTSSFAIKAIAKLAPGSPTQVLLTSTANSIDPALVGLSIDVRYTSNTIHFSLLGGPLGTQYLVRNSARITVLTF
jgi:hypothetical protein